MFVILERNTRTVVTDTCRFTSLICRSLLPGFLAAGILFFMFSRCANQGMPTGGPKDSIPPLLLQSIPPMRGLQFHDKEVRLTFNEFITSDAVPEALVVSPPLTKRPSIRTKSKSLIVAFNEELKPGVTYSLDFKNSVTDFNEQNPYPGLRMLFSTGDVIDTLRVAGMVKNAGNLEPREKITVMLYGNPDDTAVMRSQPDYIARTDARGLFLFDNIKPGSYRLYAIDDANNNLRYDTGAEDFAFADSLVIPSALFEADPDTLVAGADSLLILGHTRFFPDPFYLRLFTEEMYEQYLDKSVRDTRYKLTFVFNEPVSDTFNIRLPSLESGTGYLTEANPETDSLTVWITDTLTARNDTLELIVEYYQRDSLKRQYLQQDTLNLLFADRERADTRRRKKEDEAPGVMQFQFTDNLKPAGFDLNLPVLVQAPEPVKAFDFSAIRLTLADDTTRTPLKIQVSADTTRYRTYRIAHAWEPNTAYQLSIDSAACENIYGITSQAFSKKFTTREEDYYGRILLNITRADYPMIIQLLDNSSDERIIKTAPVQKTGTVTFDYLPPDKYRVKVIFDRNGNDIWDAGDFQSRRQPERVAYLPEIIKVRSNWDNSYEWDLKPDPTFRKILVDKEEEELRLKKMKEQKAAEQEEEPPFEDFNIMP